MRQTHRLGFTRSTQTCTLGGLMRLVLALGMLSPACGPAASAPAAAPAPAQTDPAAASTGSAQPASYETLPLDQRERPPEAGPAPTWKFPAVYDASLGNGLALKLMERRTLPLVRVSLVVRSGQATEPKRPGLAVLAGEMLKVGGTDTMTSSALLDKVESLGSSLDITTTRDATTLSMSVTSDRFEEALNLLGLVVQKPRFATDEYNKLEQRERDRTSSQARTSAAWAASMVMYRELYRSTKGVHPYSVFDATAEQVERLQLNDVKQWYKSYVTPKNSVLVVAGDVDPARAKAAAEQAFSAWKGAAVKAAPMPRPSQRDTLEVFLVDRPKSSQAEVRVAAFGPDGKSPGYPRLRVMNQLLGGGVAGRLFADVREKRSLAYSTFSSVERMLEGPSPILLQAGTQTAKAGLTLQALLEHADKLAVEAPAVDEAAIAARYLADLFLLRMETVGAMADMVAQLAIFDLPNDYYDQYRVAVSTTSAADAALVAKETFSSRHYLVVVAGDAERLTTPLSHFGKVTVIDPNQGFNTVREVPQNPAAAIELERLDGT
jgi:zinc protease